MNTDYIKEYLKDYFAMDNPQYAVMLKGKWGCGKTYFIKNIIGELASPEATVDEIALNPIYISLNGVSSKQQITYLIKREISPILYSKGVKVAKHVILGGIKYVTGGAIDLNNDGEGDDISKMLDIDAILDILAKPNC
ncbi:MAG: P-loop NTPase fold protein [Rikenellaceae bacterium]